MPVKILIILFVMALPLIPTFWAIRDIVTRRFQSQRKKVVWFLAVSSLPFFGAMFYIMIGRRGTQPTEIAE